MAAGTGQLEGGEAGLGEVLIVEGDLHVYQEAEAAETGAVAVLGREHFDGHRKREGGRSLRAARGSLRARRRQGAVRDRRESEHGKEGGDGCCHDAGGPAA
jgi:hypothetical protein